MESPIRCLNRELKSASISKEGLYMGAYRAPESNVQVTIEREFKPVKIRAVNYIPHLVYWSYEK